jgi:hypothetical protein
VEVEVGAVDEAVVGVKEVGRACNVADRCEIRSFGVFVAICGEDWNDVAELDRTGENCEDVETLVDWTVVEKGTAEEMMMAVEDTSDSIVLMVVLVPSPERPVSPALLSPLRGSGGVEQG